MKRTFATPEEAHALLDRPDFFPVCRYYGLTPEPGEIGGIFKNLQRSGSGWQGECVERIFVREESCDER